jgi:hypothetical protein
MYHERRRQIPDQLNLTVAKRPNRHQILIPHKLGYIDMVDSASRLRANRGIMQL